MRRARAGRNSVEQDIPRCLRGRDRRPVGLAVAMQGTTLRMAEGFPSRMKKFILIVSVASAALFTTPTLTFAEDNPGGGPPPHRGGPGGPGGGPPMDPAARLKMMTEKLGLTQDQQDKIKAIFANYGPQIKDLETKLHDLKQAEHGEVDAVLTADQKAKMKAMHPGGPGGHRGGPEGGHKPGGPPPGAPQ